MRKNRDTRLPKDWKGNHLVPHVVSQSGRHEVLAPVSSVRIGETDADLVRSRCRLPTLGCGVCGSHRKRVQRCLDRHDTSAKTVRALQTEELTFLVSGCSFSTVGGLVF